MIVKSSRTLKWGMGAAEIRKKAGQGWEMLGDISYDETILKSDGK